MNLFSFHLVMQELDLSHNLRLEGKLAEDWGRVNNLLGRSPDPCIITHITLWCVLNPIPAGT
jgi:hypothetical protein